MNYTPLNDFVLIEKIVPKGMVVAGKDEDPNATLHGKVIKHDIPKVMKTCSIDNCTICHPEAKQSLVGSEVVFVRGQARKIELDGKEYFIIKEDKLLLCRN